MPADGLYIDGLVQQRRNSSVLAMELHLSCTNPLIHCQCISRHCNDLVSMEFFSSQGKRMIYKMQINISMYFFQNDLARKELSISKAQCKKDETPLLTHWSYIFLALTHRYVFTWFPNCQPMCVIDVIVQEVFCIIHHTEYCLATKHWQTELIA